MRLLHKSLISTLCLGTFVFFLPPLLSTPIGNRLVSKTVSSLLKTPVQIKGSLSYFHEARFNYFKIAHPQAQFISNDVTVNHILTSLLNIKTLSINIEGFELYWTQGLIKPPLQQATITPFVLNKMSLPFIDLRFEEGKIYQETQTLAAQNIEGSIFFDPKKPINLNLRGSSGDHGLIQISGKIDQELNNMDLDVNITKCATSSLPKFIFSEILGDLFDLEFTFKGSYLQGKTAFDFNSDYLSIKGALTHSKKTLFIHEPCDFIIKKNNPFQIKDIQFSDLQGKIRLSALQCSFGEFFKSENIDFKAALSTGSIKFQNIDVGPAVINSTIHQIDQDVACKLNLGLNENGQLSIEGLYKTNSVDDSNFNYTAKNLPFDKFYPQLGTQIELNGIINIKDRILNLKTQGRSTTIEKLSLEAQVKEEKLDIQELDVEYKSFLFQGLLSSKNLCIPLHDPSLMQGSILGTLLSYQGLDPHILPAKLDCQIQSFDKIVTHLISPVGEIKGALSYKQNPSIFLIKDPFKGSFTLNPDLFKNPYLTQPIQGDLKIINGSSSLALNCEITLKPFSLNEKDPVSIRDLKSQIDINLSSKVSKVLLNSHFKDMLSKEGYLQLNCEFLNTNLLKGQLEIKNPPLAKLGLLNHDLSKLAHIVGSEAEGTINFERKEQGYLSDINFKSSLIHLRGSLLYGEHLSLLKPVIGTLKITTLDLPFYKKPLPYKLKKSCDVDFQINSLNLPIHEKESPNWNIEAHVNVKNLGLIQDSKVLELDAFVLDIKKNQNQNSLFAALSSDVYSSYNKSYVTGQVEGKLDISNLQGPIYNLDLQDAKIQCALKLDNFPTLFLDTWAQGFNMPFTSTFGEALQIKFDLKHDKDQGYLSFLGVGKDTLIKLSAAKSGDLYHLKDDVLIQTRISEPLSLWLFQNKPMGIEKFSSSYPMVCKVSAPGSQFSLFPFETKKLVLKECVFDLGRVNLESETLLPQALNLLRSSVNTKKLPVWFQPITTSIQYGILNFPRFDFLVADAYQMALWGDIDLNQNQVGMILGLTATCLQKAFGITQLPSTYVLQIPVYGKVDDVKIDSKKAATKIGKLIALQQGGALLEQFGGKSGGIVGGLFKELSKIPDGDKAAPPPQKPFPWEKETAKTSHTTPKKKAIRSSDSPIKQIIKMFF